MGSISEEIKRGLQQGAGSFYTEHPITAYVARKKGYIVTVMFINDVCVYKIKE